MFYKMNIVKCELLFVKKFKRVLKNRRHGNIENTLIYLSFNFNNNSNLYLNIEAYTLHIILI